MHPRLGNEASLPDTPRMTQGRAWAASGGAVTPEQVTDFRRDIVIAPGYLYIPFLSLVPSYNYLKTIKYEHQPPHWPLAHPLINERQASILVILMCSPMETRGLDLAPCVLQSVSASFLYKFPC